MRCQANMLEGCFLFTDLLYDLVENIKRMFVTILDALKLGGLRNMVGDKIRFHKRALNRLVQWT